MLYYSMVAESTSAQSTIPMKIVPVVVSDRPEESGTVPPKLVPTPMSK